MNHASLLEWQEEGSTLSPSPLEPSHLRDIDRRGHVKFNRRHVQTEFLEVQSHSNVRSSPSECFSPASLNYFSDCYCDCCLWLLTNGPGRLARVFPDGDVSRFEWMLALARKFYHLVQRKMWNSEGAVAHCHLQAVKTRGAAKGHVSPAEAQTVKEVWEKVQLHFYFLLPLWHALGRNLWSFESLLIAFLLK